MRHVRMLGLCLVAVFALGAVVASGASAGLPEFGTCEKAIFGKYKDAACTEPAANKHSNEGKYEWYTGKHYVEPGGFVSSTGIREFGITVHLGPTSFETATGKTISCGGGRGAYELASSKTLLPRAYLEFNECESGGKECNSIGYEEEGIISGSGEHPLTGKLGVIKAPTEVGLDIGPSNENEPHEIMFLVECQGALAVVYIGGSKHGGNSVISSIEPVNVMTSAFTQQFSGINGQQNPLAFEGKKEDALQEQVNGVVESSAWNGTWTLEPENAIEIKTIP